MGAAQLLAAVSYMTDIIPDGSHFHTWRVALVGRHLASILCPDIQREVFYAGLLCDVAGVGAHKHITHYASLGEQLDDVHVRSHPQRGAAMINWLPGMGAVAQLVRSHHEWWDGRGYPEGLSGGGIPLGSRILGITDAADVAGCFKSSSGLRRHLPSLSALTGCMWPAELWTALVSSTKDAGFYRSVTNPDALPGLISKTIAELPPPDEIENPEGVERVFHLFAALVDLKDPSTSGHSLRTARRAQTLAAFMKMPDELARLAYRAGLVHDCGRLGVDTCILNKTGRLSDKEMDVVRKHAQMTIRILGCLPDCPEMAELGDTAGHDHERYDGAGYPDGLAGERIPMISRMLSVVDAYDSMVSSANYRLLTPKGAVVRIEQAAGKQFDPEVARAMSAALSSGVLDGVTAAAA